MLLPPKQRLGGRTRLRALAVLRLQFTRSALAAVEIERDVIVLACLTHLVFGSWFRTSTWIRTSMQQIIEHLHNLLVGHSERFVVVLNELQTNVLPRGIEIHELDPYLLDCSRGGCEIFRCDNNHWQAKIGAKNSVPFALNVPVAVGMAAACRGGRKIREDMRRGRSQLKKLKRLWIKSSLI